MDDVIHLAIVSVPKQDSMGSFNNYVDKKRWLGGQKKVHAWSREQMLSSIENVYNST